MPHLLFRRPTVVVDAHARSGIALRDLQRNLRRLIGVVAGIGADVLDQGQPFEPALTNTGGLNLLQRFQTARILGQAIHRDVHLLLDQHLEGLRHRAALAGVGERDLAAQLGIGQVAPLRGFLLHAQAFQDIAIEHHAEAGHAGARPAQFWIIEGLAADLGLNARVAEPFRVLRLDASQASASARVGGDDRAIARLLGEIIRSTAEEQVHADAHARLQEFSARGIAGVRLGIEEARRDLTAPGLLQLVLPVLLKRGGEVGLDQHPQLGGPRDAPVDEECLTRGALPVLGKRWTELAPNGLRVRCHDHQPPVVARGCGAVRRTQDEWPSKHGDKG